MDVLRAIVHSDQHQLVIAKVSSAFILGLSALFCAVLPIIFTKKCGSTSTGVLNSTAQKALNIMLRIGGGILIATTFLHLLPEVREGFEDLVKLGTMPNNWPVQIPELIMCLGFFIMYGVEECAHICLFNGQVQQEHGSQKLNHSFEFADVHRLLDDESDEEIVNFSDKPEEKMKCIHHDKLDSNSELSADEDDNINEGHSHVVSSTPLRGILIVIALSVHQVFEGLAVGLEGDVSQVWVLMGAIAAHKCVIAICVGAELASAKTTLLTIAVCVGVFAIASPLGIGVGVALSTGHGSELTMNCVSVILQGLATGTLLYVVFFEVLNNGRENGGLTYFFATSMGFVVMLIFICCFQS